MSRMTGMPSTTTVGPRRRGRPPRRPHKCLKCDEAFAQETELIEHMETHVEYPCRICNKTFRRKSNRTVHLRRYHCSSPQHSVAPNPYPHLWNDYHSPPFSARNRSPSMAPSGIQHSVPPNHLSWYGEYQPSPFPAGGRSPSMASVGTHHSVPPNPPVLHDPPQFPPRGRSPSMAPTPAARNQTPFAVQDVVRSFADGDLSHFDGMTLNNCTIHSINFSVTNLQRSDVSKESTVSAQRVNTETQPVDQLQS